MNKTQEKPSGQLSGRPNGNAAGKKAIFFDRDGTLIIDKIYLNDPEQIVYLPEVFPTLASLRDAGYVFVIVTNQSGVPRGLVTIENLNEIHRRIQAEFSKHQIEFAGIYYAAHSVESNHPLRKPNAGMLLQAAEDHGLDLTESWMIGDRTTDVEAGRKAGCRTILIQGVETPEAVKNCAADAVVSDLPSLLPIILK